MDMTRKWVVVAAGLLFLMAAGVATAEIEVSITLTGDIDELIPILVHLRNMGVGTGAAVEMEDPVKLRVHSMTVGTLDEVPGEEETAAAVTAPPTPVVPPEPKLSLSNPAVTPPNPKAGQEVLITVTVTDPGRAVDTVALEIPFPDGLTKDLYDNGGHGDQVAGDGVWSCMVSVPPRIPAGKYAVEITAYDANGDPVVLPAEDGTEAPLVTATTISIAE